MEKIIARGLKNYSIIFPILIILLQFNSTIFNTNSQVNPSAPVIINGSINPNKAQPGNMLTVSVTVFDFFGVEKVEANFFHENGFDVVDLFLVSGTVFHGVWEGQWIVHDTIVKEYCTTVYVFSKTGNFSSINLSWFDPAPWYINWRYRKLITLNHSQVPNDLTNFPVLISVMDNDLKDKAQSDGDDILFTDSNGNKLNHEIEEYNSTTGKLIAWVNVPSLSSSSGTQIYMYYGNSTCESQQNPANVWLGFSMVYHFNEPAGTSGSNSVNDSTGKTSGTPSNGIIFGQTGKIGSAANFSNGTGIDCGILGPSLLTAETTISFWIYSNNVATPARQNPFNQAYGGWGTMTLETNGAISWFFGSNGGDNSPYGSHQSRPSTVTAGSWIYITAVRNPNGYSYSWYKNGDYLTGSTYSNTYPVIASRPFTIGDGYVHPLNGKIDEFRVSTVAHSNAWIKTAYNNQNNASNGGFFTVGEEELAAPTKPNLLSPGNNTALNNTRPTFQWGVCENHENYTIYVNKTSDFSNPHINISLSPSTNSYETPEDLLEGKWYWKVVANNSQGTNSSDVWSFIVDETKPEQVTLISPKNNSTLDRSSVTFIWYPANDTINASVISNIKYYQIQIADNENFTSPKNYYTSYNTTTYLTINLIQENLIEIGKGKLYWKVCAWDNAYNQGEWSEPWNLTIFNYSFSADSYVIQIQRGTIGSTTLILPHNFGVGENVSLDYQWTSDNKPNSVIVNFSINNAPVPFNSTMTFTCGENASTGTYTCTIYANATFEPNISQSINIEVTVYSMLFSLDVFPRSLSLIRSDQGTATISVNFDQGSLSTVTFNGDWIGTAPSGVSIVFNPSSGTPNFDSTITFTTSSTATEGSFVYKVTGTSSGLTKIANIYIDISKNLTITISTDKQTYEKGENIHLSGFVKDPKGNSVSSGTVTINLSAGDWYRVITTSVIDGIYGTSFYITFDKPDGTWDILVSAFDVKGHVTSSLVKVSVSVFSPNVYQYYLVSVLSPGHGQVFRRGDIVSFSVSLFDIDGERVRGADVKVFLDSGGFIVFSESAPGIYSGSFELGYDFVLGDCRVYVEGKKFEDDKVKVGFNFIDFKVSSVTLIVKLVDVKPGVLVEIGELVTVSLQVLYPSGVPVDDVVLNGSGPGGAELLFSKCKSELGVYSASFVPLEDDVGSWVVFVDALDVYGNFYTGGVGSFEVVHTKILTYLFRFWWLTAFVFFVVLFFSSYFVRKSLGRMRIRRLKEEILELKKLKERNAIFYYSDFSINRDTYDHLCQEYDGRIALLSKRLRLLEKKFGKKDNVV